MFSYLLNGYSLGGPSLVLFPHPFFSLTFICWWFFVLYLQLKTHFSPWTLNIVCGISPLGCNTSTTTQTFPNMNSFPAPPLPNKFVPSHILHTSMNGSVIPPVWKPYLTPPSHSSHSPCLVTRLCCFYITNLFHIYLLLILYCKGLQPESHSFLARLFNNFLSPCFPLLGWFSWRSYQFYYYLVYGYSQLKTIFRIKPKILSMAYKTLQLLSFAYLTLELRKVSAFFVLWNLFRGLSTTTKNLLLTHNTWFSVSSLLS